MNFSRAYRSTRKHMMRDVDQKKYVYMYFVMITDRSKVLTAAHKLTANK